MSSSAKILIADDENTFLNSTADLLRKEGYECACASDAFTAAGMLRENGYDLLISDIQMPGNTELELIRNLSESEGALPVILITGYPSVLSAAQSLRLCVVDYLVKPLAFRDLLESVTAAIKHRRISAAVKQMELRLRDWTQEISAIQDAMKDLPKGPMDASAETFVNLNLSNTVGSLSDLKRLTVILAGKEIENIAYRLLDCPRQAAFTETIKDTIAVLERTKSSFKSKELGVLRRRLTETISDS